MSEKIEILGDEKTLRSLRGAPDIRVGAAGQVLPANRVHVVTQSRAPRTSPGQVLVEF
jgi:hypothetical protein